MIEKGVFITKTESILRNVKISELSEGLNDFKNHFIIVKKGNVEHIINKICDHHGGRLISKNDQLICPLHEWKLNPNSLEYENGIKKTPIKFTHNSNNTISFSDYETSLENPFMNKIKGDVEIRWLNHACVYIKHKNFSLVTDPWLFGPAFMTGWWLTEPSAKDSLELIQNADYIYIYRTTIQIIYILKLFLYCQKIKKL